MWYNQKKLKGSEILKHQYLYPEKYLSIPPMNNITLSISNAEPIQQIVIE